MHTANHDHLRRLATQAAQYHAPVDELAYIEREARTQGEADAKQAVFDALLAACHEAHMTICHYDLVRRHNGVDWEPVEELQAKLEAQLWDAITLAQPELKLKNGTGEPQ